MPKTLEAADFAGAPSEGIPPQDSGSEPADTDSTAQETSSYEEPIKAEGESPAGEETFQKPEEEEKPSPEPKFKPKHASWEETERARIEAEREMTRAKQEAARYRRILETMKTSAPDPQAQVRNVAKWAIEEINKIPEDDPEKEIKAGEIWIQAQIKASQLIQQAERQKEQANKELLDYTTSLARDLGMKTEADMDAFWVVASMAPKDLPLEEAVRWTVEQVKAFKERVLKESRAAQVEEEKTKKNLQVMGRGASNLSSSTREEHEAPATIADAIMASRTQRKVRASDFR